MIDPDDLKNMQDSIARLSSVFDRRAAPPVNAATITINAGGLGLWVAVTCCIVMFLTSFIFAAFFIITVNGINAELHDRKEENSKMQSYLNAIYVNAPSLKPADKK